VNKILGSGDGPIPISERVIETIRGRVGEDNLVKLENDFKEGDLVQVTSGPLKDLVGVFQKGCHQRTRQDPSEFDRRGRPGPTLEMANQEGSVKKKLVRGK